MPTKNHFPRELPSEGFVRLNQFIPNVIPVSKSTWWSWVKSGHAPAPTSLSRKITCWDVIAVRKFIEDHKNNSKAVLEDKNEQ